MMPHKKLFMVSRPRQIALSLLLVCIFAGGVWVNSGRTQTVSNTITISSPTTGTIVVPGQTLQVSVNATRRFEAVQIIGEDIGISPPKQTPPYSFVLTIPNNIIGPKKITALGIIGRDNGVFSQPVLVDVELQTPLTNLNATPSRINFDFVGDQVNLTVIGKFSDGTEADITHSSNVSYQTHDATVAKVTSAGAITATGVGTTGILIRYGDVLAAVPVAVKAAFAGTPGSSVCEGKSVSALTTLFGGIDTAAKALGFSSTQALQDAIRAFCAAIRR